MEPVEPDQAPTGRTSELERIRRHAGFLASLLGYAVVDGLFLLATYFWQRLINDLMDPSGLTGADAFFFGATRLALSTTPFVIILVWTLNDLLGAVRRVWGRS